jgi:hypothetical protein
MYILMFLYTRYIPVRFFLQVRVFTPQYTVKGADCEDNCSVLLCIGWIFKVYRIFIPLSAPCSHTHSVYGVSIERGTYSHTGFKVRITGLFQLSYSQNEMHRVKYSEISRATECLTQTECFKTIIHDDWYILPCI